MGCNTSKESTPQAENEQKNADGGADTKDDKPASAKTITLTSNGTLVSSTVVEDKNEEQAATKIQAAFRGHKTRKSIKQTQQETATETTLQFQEEFKPEDKELVSAATKIQANFRGHISRRQMDKKNETTSKEQKNQENEEELDIDLSDPDLNKAAVKIQASFRGHMVRKEHEDDQPSSDNQQK